jgi:hypothetical protein
MAAVSHSWDFVNTDVHRRMLATSHLRMGWNPVYHAALLLLLSSALAFPSCTCLMGGMALSFTSQCFLVCGMQQVTPA